MAIQSVVVNHLWFLMSLTPFLRLPKRLVRSTWSKLRKRSFKSELKWDGKRTWAGRSREQKLIHLLRSSNNLTAPKRGQEVSLIISITKRNESTVFLQLQHLLPNGDSSLIIEYMLQIPGDTRFYSCEKCDYHGLRYKKVKVAFTEDFDTQEKSRGKGLSVTQ